MNHYQLILPPVPSQADLRALSLLVLFGEEVTVQRSPIEIKYNLSSISASTQGVKAESSITALSVSALVPFAITNIRTQNLIQTVYSSETQQTFESFDKPIVEAGDIVVALAKTAAEESEVGANYDDFVKINHTSPVYIGVANSSKSQFNSPFEGLTFVVIGKRNFSKMTESIMQTSESLKSQIELIASVNRRMSAISATNVRPVNTLNMTR
jgi:hypothetical protein